LFSVINESCVIKSNSDDRIDSIEHHLEDAIVLNRENELSLRCGRNIDVSLTSIDRALSPNLGVVSKENPHSLNKETYVGHKLKRIVARKLLNRRKRSATDGWILLTGRNKRQLMLPLKKRLLLPLKLKEFCGI
jgi:hypothetical protein